MYCCFFFKQKTAYEMRISDWSSDVCSSDLAELPEFNSPPHARLTHLPNVRRTPRTSKSGRNSQNGTEPSALGLHQYIQNSQIAYTRQNLDRKSTRLNSSH